MTMRGSYSSIRTTPLMKACDKQRARSVGLACSVSRVEHVLRHDDHVVDMQGGVIEDGPFLFEVAKPLAAFFDVVLEIAARVAFFQASLQRLGERTQRTPELLKTKHVDRREQEAVLGQCPAAVLIEEAST